MLFFTIPILSCYFIFISLLPSTRAGVRLSITQSGCQKSPFQEVVFNDVTSQIFNLAIGTEKYITTIKSKEELASKPRAQKSLGAVITQKPHKQFKALREIHDILRKLREEYTRNHVSLYCGKPPLAVWENNWRVNSRDSTIKAQATRPCAHRGVLYETSKPWDPTIVGASHPFWIAICPPAIYFFQKYGRFSLAHPLMEMIPPDKKFEWAVDLSGVSKPFNNIDLYSHKFYSLYLMGLHSIFVAGSSFGMSHSSNLQESSVDFAQAVKVRQSSEITDEALDTHGALEVSAVKNPSNFVQFCLRVFLGMCNDWQVDGPYAEPSVKDRFSALCNYRTSNRHHI